MSAEETWYIDSSAIVKLVAREPESPALRRFLNRRRTLVASALAQTEVSRAVLSLGEPFLRKATDVLDRIELVRVNRQVLADAALLEPVTLRSLMPFTWLRRLSSQTRSVASLPTTAG